MDSTHHVKEKTDEMRKQDPTTSCLQETHLPEKVTQRIDINVLKKQKL